MKFLLVAINAKYIHTNPAIYSLYAYAGKELQKHLEKAEYTINRRKEEIIADLFRRKPDVLAFSCYIWNWKMVKELLTDLKKVLPHTEIWLGGPEVSYNPEEVLEDFPQVSGILLGEGEETLKELVTMYVSREDVMQLPGTCTRQGNFGMRPLLPMEKLPFAYREMSEKEWKELEHRILYYEASRGCPFSCSYCMSSIDKSVRFQSPERVYKELQFFLDRKVKQVKFIDRTFNAKGEFSRAIWRYLHEHDNGVTNFHFEVSADLFEEEDMEILSQLRPGLIQLEIGVQTTNLETLKAIHRPSVIEKVAWATEKIRLFQNVHQHLDLIAGLPYENLESFKKSFRDTYLMKPNQLQLGFLKVLKGSEMAERAKEYGIEYETEPMYEVYSTNWINYEEIRLLKGVEEMLERFYNSGQFSKSLALLETLYENPFDLYQELSAYYEACGYYEKSPARAAGYEILLAFAGKKKPEWKERFRECLIYDFYEREKPKSRPDFAGERSHFEEIKAFYEKEMETPFYLKEYVEKGYDAAQIRRMTHVEYFDYSVWEEGEIQKEGGMILFTYGTMKKRVRCIRKV